MQRCLRWLENVQEYNRKDYKASIFGIYGQNGSGKTALIDAIAIGFFTFKKTKKN